MNRAAKDERAAHSMLTSLQNAPGQSRSETRSEKPMSQGAVCGGALMR